MYLYTDTPSLLPSPSPPLPQQKEKEPIQQDQEPTTTALLSYYQTLFSPFPQPEHSQGLPENVSSSAKQKSEKQGNSSSAVAAVVSSVESESLKEPADQIYQQRLYNHHYQHSHLPTDYRLGKIRVASLDNSNVSSAPTKDRAGIKQKTKSNKKMVAAATLTTRGGAGFQESEPAQQGILRLYKDTNEITTGTILIETAKDEQISTAASTATTATHDHGHDHERDRDREREGAQIIHPDYGTSVCVLAVPSYMSPGDFLNFVGPVRANVSHFRIIRDSVPNRFMVLMKFRTSEATAEFYARYNGKAFSSLEPEICHVVYLKSIEIRSGCVPPYAFPFLNEDPFLQNTSPHVLTTPSVASKAPSTTITATASTTSSSSSAVMMNPLSPYSTDHAGLAELPTCPVCLERMDSSVTGLLTILCQHTFHCHCLSKWGEGSCPVCRYSQKTIKKANAATGLTTGDSTPLDGLTASTDGVTEDRNVCAMCNTTENLWICLICGHIGCGRYQEKHAYHHYYETSHLYALELETQRVWDYAGDGYVHRLIQNKADGKLVELPSAVDGAPTSHPTAQVGQEKLDAIGLEYTYLLTSQLESQRLYFDAQMAAMAAQLAQVNKEAKEWEKEAAILDQKNRELAKFAELLEKEKVPMLLKEKKAAEKRLEKMQERLQMLERQYEEEKEMNVGLRNNQDSFKEKLQVKEAEILELQDQVRDMMIYLDTQQKVEASPMKDELVGGTIGVVMNPAGSAPSSSSPSSSHTRRKGGRR
ncbi:hypothetical protein BGZ50_005390 [Haplosporangium sp. Z 11]|nr:hypothetical protein BGZ50_005390 [Haplosporangium sp. Z 11]